MIGAFIQLNLDSPKAKSHPVGYVICENGCWEWTGSQVPGGYGNMWNPETKRLIHAHKWSWEQKNGPVPEGLELDHFYCDNPTCMNPDHVRPVTRRENVLRSRGFTAQHAARTHCPRGHSLSGDNLVASELQRGIRRCRTCRIPQVRQAGARRRAKKARA